MNNVNEADFPTQDSLPEPATYKMNQGKCDDGIFYAPSVKNYIQDISFENYHKSKIALQKIISYFLIFNSNG
jgi:hypothetical protein